VDIREATLTLQISEAEMEERRSRWVKPEPKIKKGMMHIYAQLCRSAEEGAGITI